MTKRKILFSVLTGVILVTALNAQGAVKKKGKRAKAKPPAEETISSPQTKPAAQTQPESKPQNLSFQEGEQVEAFWHGAWYKAKVEFVMKEGIYKVHFHGYWHNRDELISAERLRRIVSRVSPDPRDLTPGAAIEVYQGDHYKPGVFVGMKNDKAVIRFADGEKQKEELVPVYKVTKVQ